MFYESKMKNDLKESIFRLQNVEELNLPQIINPINPDLMETLKGFSDSMNFLREKYKVNTHNICIDLRMSMAPQNNFESGEWIIYPHLNYKIIID